MENIIGAKVLAPLTFLLLLLLLLSIPNVRLVYQVSNRICLSIIFGIEEVQKKVNKIKYFSIRRQFAQPKFSLKISTKFQLQNPDLSLVF